MHMRKYVYSKVEDMYTEREAISWYWKVTAVASSWMILGGYLLLPETFNTDAGLRFSKGVLSILIVALLTGGYSLTALLWFACRSLLFRHEDIFFPALSSSILGLLVSLYCLASSSKFNIKQTSAPITLGLACASIIVYGALYFFSHRRIKQMRRQYAAAHNARSYGVTNGSPGNNLWQEPSYYQNFIANMHPTARNPSPTDTAHRGSNTFPPVTDDDLVNQQMAMLLMKSDPGPSPDASSSTFRIDLPAGDDDDRPTSSEGSSRLTADGRRSMPQGYERARTRSDSRDGGSRSAWGRFATVVERGRQGDRRDAQPRAKSREERRREIELGAMR